MTSTEIAIRQPGGVAERDVVDGWITVATDVSKLSDYIADTDFVPKALRNRPAAIAACILTGRELGIGPMASLKSIHMVQGVPSLSAEYKRARALAAGHQIVIDESTATRCVVRGRRAGSDAWVTVTWTMDMATRAKLNAKDVWKQYPQRMLQARASSELCDLLFPDASLGLETTEVLADGGALAINGADVVTVAEAEGIETAPAKPAARTAQRRTATRKPHVDRGEQGINMPPAAPDPDLPPLPGEDEPDPAPAPQQATASAPSESAGGEPDERDYDSPGTVTTPQITAIWTVLSKVFEFGSDEKDQARGVCANILQRPLESTKDMSRNEAKAVLDTLAMWRELAEKNQMTARQLLLQMLVEAAGDGD